MKNGHILYRTLVKTAMTSNICLSPTLLMLSEPYFSSRLLLFPLSAIHISHIENQRNIYGDENF